MHDYEDKLEMVFPVLIWLHFVSTAQGNFNFWCLDSSCVVCS